MPGEQMSLPVGRTPGTAAGAGHSLRKSRAGSGKGFAKALDSRLQEGLRFSKHAEARLASRDIPLTDAQRERLAVATSEAEKRGAREALLLMGNMGFIVSVPNRTVITALDSSRMAAGVITGIDAAVVVPHE